VFGVIKEEVDLYFCLIDSFYLLIISDRCWRHST